MVGGFRDGIFGALFEVEVKLCSSCFQTAPADEVSDEASSQGGRCRLHCLRVLRYGGGMLMVSAARRRRRQCDLRVCTVSGVCTVSEVDSR